jgi:hypothetical protein
VIALLVTIAVAALSYAGAVRTLGLFVFVLPAMLLAAATCLRLVRHRAPAAVAVIGLAVALALAEIVNVLSGLSYGPAARSSFAAAAGAAVAIATARSRFPALCLLPVAEILAGALALGAGGEVKGVAVVTAACAVVALARLDAERARWVGSSRMSASLLIGVLLVVVVGGATVMLQDQRITRRPSVLFPSVTDQAVHPFWREHAPVPKPRTPKPAAGSSWSTARPTHPKNEVGAGGWAQVTTLVLTSIVVTLGLATGIRLLLARRAWSRLRRRLATGEPAATAVGAWIWLRMSLAVMRRGLPADLSPERAADVASGLPSSAVGPFAVVGTTTALAAFAAPGALDAADAAAAWAAADAVVREVAAGLATRQRIFRMFRSPPALFVPVASVSPGPSVVSMS